MLLIDTHVWLWSAEGAERHIGPKTRRLLAAAHARAAVFVSPASIFEVVALHTSGRIQLAHPPEQWIRESIHTGGLRVLELSPAVAIDAGRLTRAALADPLDRLIVATASHAGATMVTSDPAILGYAEKTRHVRVHDARR